MLVKIEARVLIFPDTDFHFPSTSVPPGTFLGSGLDGSSRHFPWNNKTTKLKLRIGVHYPLYRLYAYRDIGLPTYTASDLPRRVLE